MDLNDFDRNELYELYKFLYRLNPNIMWESFLMEKKENIKTLFDFLKIIKYKIWKDKSLSYDYIMPREKVFEHYMELIYGEYLLKRQHTGLVVVIPDLQNCYYPDKVKECIELKLSVLRSIVNLTHMYYQEVVKNNRDGSRDKSENKSENKSKNKSRDKSNKNETKNGSENKSKNKSRDKSRNKSRDKSENKSENKSKNGMKNETKNKSIDKSNKNETKNESENGSRTNTIEDIIENKVNFALENAIVTFDMTLFGSTSCLHDPIYCENDSEKTSKRIRLIKIFCFMLFIGVDLSEIEIILRNMERYVIKN